MSHIAGVCKDILTIAGPEVQTELRSGDKYSLSPSYLSTSWSEVSSLRLCSALFLPLAHVTRGGFFESKPGRFSCKSILHVNGEKDATVIQCLVCYIMKTCEQKGHQSVAIPAICAGQCYCSLEMMPDNIYTVFFKGITVIH